MSRVIDAHVHLWDLDVRPQPWTAHFPALQRSFLHGDLEKELSAQQVDAAVVVQAGDTHDETLELLAIAATSERLVGVIGWADLNRPLDPQIEVLRSAPGGDRLVGLRHQLQLEPDPEWLQRNTVRDALYRLGELDLVFDIVVSSEQLPVVAHTVAATPGTRFVLDHAGKPPIRTGRLAAWRRDLERVASADGVAVKLSGLVTEAHWDAWTQADLQPVLEDALQLFSPGRAMLGSDWPVCLLAASYQQVTATTSLLLEDLSVHEQGQLRGGTAEEWYRLS